MAIHAHSIASYLKVIDHCNGRSCECVCGVCVQVALVCVCVCVRRWAVSQGASLPKIKTWQ